MMALRALLCALVAVPASPQLLGGLRNWAEEESNETHYWDDVRRMLLPRGRMECAVGWGQENEDNIRLYIKKEWTRVCYYCMYLETSSSSDMELLVAGSTWDEQQFYRVFYVNACGGMFGTPKYMENNNGCGKGTIDLTKNNEGDDIATVEMSQRASSEFICCNKQGGCSGAAGAFGARTLAAAAASVLAVALLS